MSGFLKTAGGGIVGLIFGYIVVTHFLGFGVSLDTKLSKAAEQITDQCPVMIDEETRLDAAIGGPGKKFTYVYTLVNHDYFDLNVFEFESMVRPALVERVRNSDEMRAFKSHDVEIVYVYNSRDEEEIARISVLPEDYK